MPKVGMEPIRREALVKATIAEIGGQGSMDVPVSRIASRAGISTALAHHYFGSKDQLFLAAMRHLLTRYGGLVRRELATATTPRARVDAILKGSLAPENFETEVIAAWLGFYVRAQSDPGAARLLAVYHARLRSNLIHALRPLAGDRAPDIAETLSELIDGVYLRKALQNSAATTPALDRLTHALDCLLAQT